MVPILEIENLYKSFGGVKATQGVSLDVARGEVHAIIGPNGAGKTTLMAQLTGSIRPDSGVIRFHGEDITRQPPHVRARKGMARSYQITSLCMDMTVHENVALAIQARGGHSFKFLKPAHRVGTIETAADETLKTVGLEDRANLLASSLSHGERRQLEIAVALATGAEFLLLDEPMAGTGQEESARVIKLLQSLRGDKSILLVEHDMDAVFSLADRISVLVYGEIIATGKPDEIRGNEAVRHAYLGDA